MFSEAEAAYVKSQRLARIGTVSAKGQPDASVVGFDFDGHSFYIGGVGLQKTRKYLNITHSSKVAVLIDDVAAVDPWTPRGVRIYGTAVKATRGGGEVIQVLPEVHGSLGVDRAVFQNGMMITKKTVHSPN